MSKQKASVTVVDQMLSKINKKEWGPGSKIPSENDLAELFSVSRTTVREAIQNLTSRGYLKRTHGVGSFVRPRSIIYGMEELLSITELIEVNGYKAGTRNISLEVCQVDKKINEYLNLSKLEPVYKLNRVRTVDGRPAVYEQTIFPCKILPDLKEEEFIGSTFSMLESRGINPQHADGWVKPVKATPKIAGELEIPEGSLLLLLETILYDQDDRPFAYVLDYFTEWFEFPIHRIRRNISNREEQFK